MPTAPVTLLYKQPSALTRNGHTDLKLRTVDDCAFASKTHWLPIAGSEFNEAARFFPIVFINDDTGGSEKIRAVALVGLEPGHNDYIGRDMKWRPNTYVPAYVRRYPFLMEPAVNSEKGFMVYYDAACPGFNTKEGMPLFNDDGNPSKLLENVVQFMSAFHNDLNRTEEFIAELQRLKLLEWRPIDVLGSDGETYQMNGFMSIDEGKIAELPGWRLSSLNRKNFLGWIFAHLVSLDSLSLLLDLHMKNSEAF